MVWTRGRKNTVAEGFIECLYQFRPYRSVEDTRWVGTIRVRNNLIHQEPMIEFSSSKPLGSLFIINGHVGIATLRPDIINFSVDPKRDSYDFGKFGWFTDPEGNRVELWQPADGE